MMISIFAINMKKVLFIILCQILAFSLHAQDSNGKLDDGKFICQTAQMTLQPIDGYRGHRRVITDEATMRERLLNERTEYDSLNLPLLNHLGQIPAFSVFCPFGMYGWSDWPLHKGLNVSLGASVFAFFGNHAFNGTGFQQTLSLMYAMSLSDRLFLAIGGYMNHMSFGRGSLLDAGISGVISYRFNDKWSAMLYAQKSFTSNAASWLRRSFYDINYMAGDRIGAAIRYAPTPSFTVEVSVDQRFYPHQNTLFMPRTGVVSDVDYPLPSQ